jgi:hypothetical protein
MTFSTKKFSQKIISIIILLAFIFCNYSSYGKIISNTFSIYADSNVIYGDLNSDGQVNAFDAALFKENLFTQKTMSLNVADVNADEMINQNDLAEIQDYVLGRSTEFSGEYKKAITSSSRTIISSTNSKETQMTTEMAQFTQKLATPLEVYRYVLNTVNTEFYYGSRKGAMGTYEQNGGNDYDQSSLLIAMLRNLGYTANYAIGDIILTDFMLNNMTATSDIETAKRIYTSQGKTLELIETGHYKTEHVFVVLEIDGIQYPLDPSFKYYEQTENHSDLENIVKDLETQYDLNNNNVDLSAVFGSIENNFDEQAFTDALSRRRITDQNIIELPTGVQYDFYGENLQLFTTISAEMSDIIELYLGDVKIFTYKSVELYGKNLTIEYELTEEAIYFLDESFNINSIDDLTGNIYPYSEMAYISAVVKIDGKRIGSGNEALLGTKENMQLYIRSAGNVKNFEKELVYGSLYSIIFDYGIISPHDIADGYSKLPQTAVEQAKTTEKNVFGSSWLMNTMTLIGKSYFSQIDTNNIVSAEFSDIHYGRELSVAVVDFIPDIYSTYISNMYVPRLYKQGKIEIDVLGNQTVFTSRTNNTEEESKIRHSTGFLSSHYEAEVIEQFTGLEAVSTSEVLKTAIENDVKILYLSKANISELSTSSLSEDNKEDITKLINEGKYVTVPNEEITIGNWTGAGWISYDPVSDTSEYIINSNLRGGLLTFFVGFSYLSSILLSVVELSWAFSSIISGISLTMTALSGGSLILGTVFAGFASITIFNPIVTAAIGAGLLIGGGFYLKNVGDRLLEQTLLMDEYIDGDTEAGEQLGINSIWQNLEVRISFGAGTILSQYIKGATAKIHFKNNYGKLHIGDVNAYSAANTTANSLVNSGISTSIIETAIKNTNFLSYTPVITNALIGVGAETANKFVETIANTLGSRVLDSVGNSEECINELIKLIAENGAEYGRNVTIIPQIYPDADYDFLMSLYRAAARQTTRVVDNVTDEVIMSEIRKIRSEMKYTDTKKRGNVAIAETNIPGLKSRYNAHSQIEKPENLKTDYIGTEEFCYQPTNPKYTAIRANLNALKPYPRISCTEYKILNNIAETLEVTSSGNIKIFTEYRPCDSCTNIIINFLKDYENITIDVIYVGDRILP